MIIVRREDPGWQRGRQHSHSQGEILWAGTRLLQGSGSPVVYILGGYSVNTISDKVGKTVDCSAALGAVISYSKPFVLGVVTDEDEGGAGTANNAPEDKANRGFRLVYNQQPCMSG